jgi:hypothetical protein
MSFMRRGTVSLAREAKSDEVATVVCMPEVDETSFFAALATRITARMLGQWDAGATWKATESEPSVAEPCSQPAYPPKRERHAEPEPCRAIRDSSVGLAGSWYRLAMARTRAAKPAADEARPAAVGKLFSETILRGSEESLGASGFSCSTVWRRARSSRKQACVRAPDTSWEAPLRSSESAVYEGEQEAVVWVRRSAWERVTLRDEFVGRLLRGVCEEWSRAENG